jgi:hypothetical protein
LALDLATIMRATRNFSTLIIGEGAFGIVYEVCFSLTGLNLDVPHDMSRD